MKMSVTRALAELKTLSDKVERAISQGVFVAVTKGQDEKKVVLNSQRSVEDTINTIKGSYDKVSALIQNRAKIKAAVVKSNAETQITLGSTTMSVAEAIEYKTSINLKVGFLNMLMNQANQARGLVEKQNKVVEEAIEKALQTVYGNEKGKVESSMYEAIAAPQRKVGEAKMLDPVNILEKIDVLRNEIEAVKTELDFILSETNAKTEIEVDLA